MMAREAAHRSRPWLISEVLTAGTLGLLPSLWAGGVSQSTMRQGTLITMLVVIPLELLRQAGGFLWLKALLRNVSLRRSFLEQQDRVFTVVRQAVDSMVDEQRQALRKFTEQYAALPPHSVTEEVFGFDIERSPRAEYFLDTLRSEPRSALSRKINEEVLLEVERLSKLMTDYGRRRDEDAQKISSIDEYLHANDREFERTLERMEADLRWSKSRFKNIEDKLEDLMNILEARRSSSHSTSRRVVEVGPEEFRYEFPEFHLVKTRIAARRRQPEWLGVYVQDVVLQEKSSREFEMTQLQSWAFFEAALLLLLRRADVDPADPNALQRLLSYVRSLG